MRSIRKTAVPSVDLVYDVECPNVAAARANLLRAFAAVDLLPRWTEHRIGDPVAPDRVRGYGSPTVLVDGRDVAGAERGADPCCRIYGAGEARAPSIELIVRALAGSSPEPKVPVPPP